MTDGTLAADLKRTSALRRMPALERLRCRAENGDEGDVCAFQLPRDASPIGVESASGRMMAIAPGDTFLSTPGYRDSKWWARGRIPNGGLLPGNDYCVLADSGLIGELVGGSHRDERSLGRVRYLGTVYADRGDKLNIRQFALTGSAETDRNARLYLVLGTSGNIGKTSAGIAVLRALRMRSHTTVITLKPTGTASMAEIMSYRDFGAAQAFDCIDFGLPSTYPAGRADISDIFAKEIDFCLSQPADALVVECGGDALSANAPEFLKCLKARRSDLKIILVAADPLGALGAKHALAEIGLTASLVAGPCTDTSVLRERTQALCGLPAINLLRGT